METPKIMRGMTTLRQYISSFLESELPPVIDVMRDHYGLSEWELPYPQKYDWYDIDLVESYPAVGILPLNDREHVRYDVMSFGGKEFRVSYEAQIFVMAHSPRDVEGKYLQEPKQQAIRLRDDLLRAVQATLLERPSLNSNGKAWLKEETMSTSFMEPFQATRQSPAWVAGAIITAEFGMQEYTVPPTYGRVRRITVETEVEQAERLF